MKSKGWGLANKPMPGNHGVQCKAVDLLLIIIKIIIVSFLRLFLGSMRVTYAPN